MNHQSINANISPAGALPRIPLFVSQGVCQFVNASRQLCVSVAFSFLFFSFFSFFSPCNLGDGFLNVLGLTIASVQHPAYSS